MMNYIKSEIYRVSHDRGIYCLVGILAGLSFLFNAVTGWFGKAKGADFVYANTSFSYSNIVANPMVFCLMGAIIGTILYEGNKKNGNLKNTVAFGISRTKIFIGECVTAVAASVISLLVVLPVYIVSAVTFLENKGPVKLNDMLTEVPAVFLLAVAAVISGIVCIEVFEKDAVGMIVWFVIWFLIPKIFFYIGLRVKVFYDIAMWMPENFFKPGGAGTTAGGPIVNMSQCITVWGTDDGMLKCIISGIIGIVVFSAAGVVIMRKKEL